MSTPPPPRRSTKPVVGKPPQLLDDERGLQHIEPTAADGTRAAFAGASATTPALDGPPLFGKWAIGGPGTMSKSWTVVPDSKSGYVALQYWTGKALQQIELPPDQIRALANALLEVARGRGG